MVQSDFFVGEDGLFLMVMVWIVVLLFGVVMMCNVVYIVFLFDIDFDGDGFVDFMIEQFSLFVVFIIDIDMDVMEIDNDMQGVWVVVFFGFFGGGLGGGGLGGGLGLGLGVLLVMGVDSIGFLFLGGVFVVVGLLIFLVCCFQCLWV